MTGSARRRVLAALAATASIAACAASQTAADPYVPTPVDYGPEIWIVSGPPEGYTNDPTPTFELASDDPAVTFWCSTSHRADLELCGSKVTLPLPTDPFDRLPEGFVRFNALAIDSTGDPGLPLGITLRVDTVAPEARMLKSRKTVRNRVAKMHFAASGQATGFRCALDRAELIPCESPLTLRGLSEGDHTFRVTAQDAAGNVDESPARYRFVTIAKPRKP